MPSSFLSPFGSAGSPQRRAVRCASSPTEGIIKHYLTHSLIPLDVRPEAEVVGRPGPLRRRPATYEGLLLHCGAETLNRKDVFKVRAPSAA